MRNFILFLKRALLVVLLLLVVVVAHPVKGLERIQGRLWQILYMAGVDVAMTPLTADMILMLDTTTDTRGYLSDYELFAEFANGSEHKIPELEQELYLLRLPILLMLGAKKEGDEISAFIDVVCRNINYLSQAKKNHLAKNWRIARRNPLPESAWTHDEVYPCFGKS